MRDRWFVRAASAATMVLAVGVLAACGSAGASTDRPGPPSADIGTQTDSMLPAAALTVPLIDATGNVHKLSDFGQKVLVISDTMTLCQETCPVDTAALLETARAVDAAGLTNEVEFLSISVDPTRDTPVQLAAYRKLFAPDPVNWLTLTGSAADIGALWDSLGVYREKVAEGSPATDNWRTGKPLTYDIDHSDELFFVDATSHSRFVLEGPPHINSSSAVPAKLYAFMDASGHQNVSAPASTAWTIPQALTVLAWLIGHKI
ncbi:MAG: SCO family protein [Jatrophihabitantaceae bacterium]